MLMKGCMKKTDLHLIITEYLESITRYTDVFSNNVAKFEGVFFTLSFFFVHKYTHAQCEQLTYKIQIRYIKSGTHKNNFQT